jgi:hypothetical protein
MKKRGTPDASCASASAAAAARGSPTSSSSTTAAARARPRASTTRPATGHPKVRVVVDPKSLLYLGGTELEWEQTLMQQGFKFVNPTRRRVRLRSLVQRCEADPFGHWDWPQSPLRRRPRGGREDAPRAVARPSPGPVRRAGASERRAALSKAVEVNEAWRIVRDPIRRAEALLELAGPPSARTGEPKPRIRSS